VPTQRSMRERAPARSSVMSAADSHSDDEVRRGVAELAARLGDRLPEVVSAISASLQDDIKDLRDEAQLPLLEASVEGNVTTGLYALRHDTPVERVEAPTAALEHARRIAQQGLPVNVLIRIYRLGQRKFTHLVFGELQRIDVAPHARVTIVETITETLFAYVDWMSQQVVEVYEEERERWLETQNSMRALRVREVLAEGKSLDIDSAIAAIRYPLRWHHVALVVWYPAATGPADELARMQRFVRELGVLRHRCRPTILGPNQSTQTTSPPYRRVRPTPRHPLGRSTERIVAKLTGLHTGFA
jgi:hypothetical protein